MTIEIKNKEMNFAEMSWSITSYIEAAWAAIASVGWYLVAIAVGLVYAHPYLKEKYKSWKLKKDELEYAAKYHKNPDLLQERLAGMEAARQRMQEKYLREAALAREREEMRKEQKRQELLKFAEGQNFGKKLGSSNDEASTSAGPSKSRILKEDYNPLMGSSGRGYKPPKRSCCGKGGCG
ncbi:selenoprotein S isoform X2 [Cephus cinctus]|uniref:Selenoprotein S isoform X2 n=1 Tax=Cephus cinctus TaxID=211228 RepID=A0AAJ7BIH9_CEPCN|nr:selenoprotein S isoform X2 [Cephus cinctus]